MAIELPLSNTNRLKLAHAFRSNERVDLSIQSVVEGQMGKAYVDHLDNPTAFMIEVSDFFWYFAGDATKLREKSFFENTNSHRLIMPSPVDWLEKLHEIFVHRLIPMERFSFSSASLSIEKINQLIQTSPIRNAVQRMDLKSIESELHSTQGYLDLSEYDSAQDFLRRGIGYYLMEKGGMAGVAYSSLVCSQGIEISIFVAPEYRRRGIGTVLGCLLVKYCLENNLDPHWDAANPESCKLAEKLGYTSIGSYQAYYLTE